MINLTFDVEGAKEQLTQVFRDRITAQGSINNVQNVELKDISFSELAQPIPNQAQLIAELKGDLATAQANGGNWLNNLQPQLTAIPQAVINHATLWNTVIPEVLAELGKAEPDREQLQQLFQGLKHSVDQQVSKLSPLLASIQAFRATAATDASNFSDAHAPFQQIEAIDKQNLASAQATLAKIALLLNQYNEEIDVDMITAEKDLAIATNAMKYGQKFGDPGKILGLTIGLIFIVSATFAIDDLLSAVSARLAEAQQQAEYDLEMTSLTTQLVSLQSASSALASLVKEIDDVITSLQGAIDGWNKDGTQLAAIVTALQGDEAINSIISQFDLGVAQGEWDEIRVFATKWQTMEVSPGTAELILDGSSNGSNS
jgi:hypothetical protein